MEERLFLIKTKEYGLVVLSDREPKEGDMILPIPSYWTEDYKTACMQAGGAVMLAAEKNFRTELIKLPNK